MIRLGVDFGTTNSVVALSDHAGCEVVRHRLAVGDGPEVVEPVFPSLVALPAPGGPPLFGLAAEDAARRASSRLLRSVKRELAGYYEGKTAWAGDRALPVRRTVTDLLVALRHSVLASLDLPGDEPFETVATVPANASGAQRWLTRRAFMDAGWGTPVRLLDEPTAAALEYASRALRRRRGAPIEPTTVLVFDLGGGTFDASLVRLEGDSVEVLRTGGIWRLGGDDFDAELEGLVVDSLGIDLGALTPIQRRALRAECRRAKESLSAYPRPPSTLRVALTDHGISGRVGSEVLVPLAELEARVDSLLDRALEVVDEVLDGAEPPDRVYLVGGSTLLPRVAERVGQRITAVVRANRPFESVAVGAALSHALAAGGIRDRLARHFGVLRVGVGHEVEYVDVLFPKGSRLPLRGQVSIVARGPYRPHWNVGVLRFLECSTLTEDRMPGRNRRDWRELRFPYDPALEPGPSLATRRPVRHDDLAVEVTEEYVLDADGVVTVRIRRRPDGHAEVHEVAG